MGTAVDVLGTGNADFHTNSKVLFGNGILCAAVSVVSAVSIFEVNAVVACAEGLSDKACYNALNDNGIACSCFEILFISIFLPLRNVASERSLYGVAFCVSDSSC